MIDRREAVLRITALLGCTLSAPTLAGVLSGCQASADGALRSLSASHKALLDVVTEHIIPQTDTPGARAARVTEFIDMLLTDFYSDADRAGFLEGLAGFDAAAQRATGNTFLDSTPEEQFALLDAMDAEAFPDLDAMSEADREAYERRRAAEGRPVFARVKELTLSGFYTSELGATQELRVNPMGSYRGDISVSEVERAWA
ncbi:MAG: gluconate 2-dehydrogenase subunit 3 family protein [Rhodothermales bacterium]